MHARAGEIAASLGLEPHPEGGRYRRIHESSLRVRAGQRERASMTAIHYLLCAGETSRWHRVDADECWHHAEGDALELHVLDPATRTLACHRLGSLDAHTGTQPLVVVPAGHWQAARPLGAYSLVACIVAPGFEFAGFTLLDGAPDIAGMIESLAPHLMPLG